MNAQRVETLGESRLRDKFPDFGPRVATCPIMMGRARRSLQWRGFPFRKAQARHGPEAPERVCLMGLRARRDPVKELSCLHEYDVDRRNSHAGKNPPRATLTLRRLRVATKRQEPHLRQTERQIW